jgi:threonine/homoserine/homoserine lactone efflux protein
MSVRVWIAFVLLETVLCLTPGPAVLYVVSTALARGGRAGIAGALGIVACNSVYFLASAAGVAAVIAASGRLFTRLTWIGAAYLAWLGIRMIVTAARSERIRAPEPDAATSLSGPLWKGFAVQASNPKAIAFFVALLPQFVNPRASVATQVAILAVTSMAIELGVLTSYVWLTGRARALAQSAWPRGIKICAGGLLIAAGARLAFLRAP